jgi:hypothetical protein
MPKRDIKSKPERDQHRAARKLEILRREIKAGVDALDRGDFIELDEADLEDFFQTAV